MSCVVRANIFQSHAHGTIHAHVLRIVSKETTLIHTFLRTAEQASNEKTAAEKGISLGIICIVDIVSRLLVHPWRIACHLCSESVAC